ncbi:DCC1-like thiol-disulfide oxidoreductase family protein [Corynebacterium mustelae]|uniref:DCC1-like thiol-disulfide oxidoreductase family protein n=1 Tax=Corynebacterium mustelae TaxID=571915 RepID=UPI00069A8E11|nr:DCC1-like thiol-disulfide oxidoreductase family protein [Corynebacterium mustelae]
MVDSDDVLFYDADCGFCERASHLLGRLTTNSVNIRPAHPEWTDCDLRVRREITDHVVAYCGGTLFVAHQAIGAILRTHGRNAGVRLSGFTLTIPLLSPLWSAIYYRIARHRSAISAFIGAPQCSIRQ